MVPFYVPVVFFYQADESKGLTVSNQARICQQMKHSLSDILTSFYPFAGSMEDDNLAINCNDAGVEFIEARFQGYLSDATNSTTEKMKQYCPMDHAGRGERHFLSVQLTLFDCGGIALGVCFSHLIFDCSSLLKFLNAWAATCRGEPELSRSVSFDLANYFPARDLASPIFWGQIVSGEKLTMKMLVFNKETIANLRKEVVSSSRSRVNDPTRVELITAFIWKHLSKMDRLRNPNSPKPFAASHAVDLRRRKELLGNVFGNCIMLAIAFADSTDNQSEVDDLVSKVSSSIRRFDDKYITEAQSGNNYIDDLYKAFSALAAGEVELCVFTSWCRFPMYEIDYGFGGPLSFRPTATETKNCVILTSSKFGDNIEAWVCAEQDTLEMLQTKINLISH